jgi:hypothetical protein
MRQKLRSPEGHAVYKMRKAVVEPVFGQIKASALAKSDPFVLG